MSKEQLATAIGGGLGMLVLILDAQTALSGAVEGMRLCIWTIIPALFPFFVVCNYMTGSLSPRFLRPLGKLCKIPAGEESLLLAGMLGGYPVGAQCIAKEVQAGGLSRQDAHRMLGFCSNAGPAFLFGIIGRQLGSVWLTLALWMIHLASAIAVSILLPGRRQKIAGVQKSGPRSSSNVMGASIQATAYVCGWVVLFRVIIAVVDRWALWLLEQPLRTLAVGLLELTNGCCALDAIAQPGARFVLCAALLGYGGVCVLMQTLSVTKDCGLGMYFPGKVLQGGISAILAFFAQFFLFSQNEQMGFQPILLVCVVTCLVTFWRIRKKGVEKSRSMLYTIGKSHLLGQEV